jgi:Ni2+-binding GTPase involved in maturation of urease and hydrogenase
MLARMGALQPVEVTLFTGPPNSGKTALLQDYCENRQHEGVCYIDSRSVNAINPASKVLVLQS